MYAFHYIFHDETFDEKNVGARLALTEVYVNLRKSGQYTVLATCDCDLIGKVLREGKIVFEIREEFYKGQRVTVEEAIQLCRQSSIVNMVGKCIVAQAVKEKLVHPEAIIKIKGVPHAQIIKM